MENQKISKDEKSAEIKEFVLLARFGTTTPNSATKTVYSVNSIATAIGISRNKVQEIIAEAIP
jgi:lambda repressor-like predicted transcriptional regulator